MLLLLLQMFPDCFNTAFRSLIWIQKNVENWQISNSSFNFSFFLMGMLWSLISFTLLLINKLFWSYKDALSFQNLSTGLILHVLFMIKIRSTVSPMHSKVLGFIWVTRKNSQQSSLHNTCVLNNRNKHSISYSITLPKI